MQISMKETVDEDTKKITGEDLSDYKLFEDWWDKNVEYVEEDIIIKSTDIWYKFKSDTNNGGKTDIIDVVRFKKLLVQHLDLLGHHNYIRIKGKSSAIEIKNYRLKLSVVVSKEEKKEKTISIVTEKKKVTKSQLQLSSEKEKEIIRLYVEENKDIMCISEDENCKVWEVVSVLVKQKVIGKRQDARGYDLYKETEEYKSKC